MGLCEEIEERVKTFLEHPIEGDWPRLWIDATYVKVRLKRLFFQHKDLLGLPVISGLFTAGIVDAKLECHVQTMQFTFFV